MTGTNWERRSHEELSEARAAYRRIMSPATAEYRQSMRTAYELWDFAAMDAARDKLRATDEAAARSTLGWQPTEHADAPVIV